MAKAKRLVSIIDPWQHKAMRLALLADGLSYSEWLRTQVDKYLSGKNAAWLEELRQKEPLTVRKRQQTRRKEHGTS